LIIDNRIDNKYLVWLVGYNFKGFFRQQLTPLGNKPATPDKTDKFLDCSLRYFASSTMK
jgi:hypothetical protein